MRRTVPSPLLSLFGRSFGGAAALLAVLTTASFLSSGCENKSIGRLCELTAAPTNQQSGLWNVTALECPTRTCIIPPQSVATVDTKAFCTAECSDDSDCDDAEHRNSKDPNDKRCAQGFACTVPFETGSLCCKKLCVCRDFLPTGYKSMSNLPATCTKANAPECTNL
jgi:hypothetical protein